MAQLGPGHEIFPRPCVTRARMLESDLFRFKSCLYFLLAQGLWISDMLSLSFRTLSIGYGRTVNHVGPGANEHLLLVLLVVPFLLHEFENPGWKCLLWGHISKFCFLPSNIQYSTFNWYLLTCYVLDGSSPVRTQEGI